MTQLTENQQKVMDAIHNGANTTETIAEKSGLAKGSIPAVINSLVKRELVVKNEDGTYTFSGQIDPTNEMDQIGQTMEKSANAFSKNLLASNSNESGRSILVLIPYKKSAAAGEELKYALRTWAKNAAFDFQVVIVGDSEPWFSEEIIHVQHDGHLVKEDCDCPAPAMVQNPQADVAHKLITAIASLQMEGEFILSNDDIFILSPQTIEMIRIPKVLASGLEQAGRSGGTYSKNAQRTLALLNKKGWPARNYGTHTPAVINARMLAEIFEDVDVTEKGYLLTSLYFNRLHSGPRPSTINGSAPNDTVLGSVYKSDPNPAVIKKAFESRWYINTNTEGWKAVKPLLEEAFPDKSKFEK